MSNNNYLVDQDKTVFMQIAAAAAVPASAQGVMGAGSGGGVGPVKAAVKENEMIEKLAQVDYLSGPNALLENATELLVLHYQLVNHKFDNAWQPLRSALNEALVKFELRCQQQGMLKALVKSAKYVLCAFIDETILNADWAKDSQWSRHSLLSHFFNETWGGETVFKMRQFCVENLTDYIQLLEMIYVFLCLGFRGKYAIQQEGEIQLERIKRETYQIIREFRGDIENAPLSPSWQSDYTGQKSLKHYQSVWIALGLSLAVLVVTYAGLSYFLNKSSGPVAEQIMTYMQAGQQPSAGHEG